MAKQEKVGTSPFPLLDLFYSPLRLLYIKGVRAQITPFTILPKVKK